MAVVCRYFIWALSLLFGPCRLSEFTLAGPQQLLRDPACIALCYRAKNIKNEPKINKDPKDALLREYQEEIQKLKAMLMGQMAVPADFATGVIFQMV